MIVNKKWIKSGLKKELKMVTFNLDHSSCAVAQGPRRKEKAFGFHCLKYSGGMFEWRT